MTLLGNTLPSCGSGVFNGSSNSKATLYCKTALIEKCRNTDPWSGFGSIKGIPFSITIPQVGIATGCFDDDLDFTDQKVNAYIASGYSPSLGKVLLTRVKNVPTGTGFIVKGAADTYEIPAVATDYTYANLLVGVLENTVVSATAGSYSNYVLGKDTEGAVGFFQADETTVPANKAYLQILTSAVTADGTSGAKTSIGLCFNDEEGTTGVDAIREQSDWASGETVIYNLNGQRKQSLTRGLNIVNGKKIFVK